MVVAGQVVVGVDIAAVVMTDIAVVVVVDIATENNQNSKQIEKTFTNPEEKPKETLPAVENHEKSTVEDVIQTLPKTVRKNVLHRFIRSNPNKMTWNDEKELVSRNCFTWIEYCRLADGYIE